MQSLVSCSSSFKLASLALFLCLPAAAHVGIPEGRAAFFDPSGALIGAGSTWGLVVENAETGVYERVCEEAFGQIPSFYHRMDTGRILLGATDGLMATDDGGCTYVQQSALLEGKRMSTLTIAKDNSARLYVTTATPDAPNGVFTSADGGATWQTTGLSDENLSFRKVITDKTGQHVFVSAVAQEAGPNLFVSHDFGTTFVPLDPGFGEETLFVVLAGYNHRTEELAYVEIDSSPTTTLRMLPRDGTTPRVVTTQQNTITDYVGTKFREYITINRQVLRTRPVGEGFEDAEFEDDNRGPVRCIFQSPSEPRHVYGCGITFQGGHFLRTLDGENWKPHIPFLNVVEKQCPAETAGGEGCAYLFEAPQDAGPGTGFLRKVEGPLGEAEIEGPNCRQSKTAPAALALLALALFAWRRSPRALSRSPT